MQDIHDLKPLFSVAFPWFSFLVALALLLGVIILASVLIWRLLKRKNPPPEPEVETPPPPPSKPPRDEALEALNELLGQNLPTDLFYLQLERILKIFLERLHQEPITGYTTQQMLLYLQQHGHPPLPEFKLEELLYRGLRAKFAASGIHDTEQKQDFETAVDFVKRHTQGT